MATPLTKPGIQELALGPVSRGDVTIYFKELFYMSGRQKVRVGFAWDAGPYGSGIDDDQATARTSFIDYMDKVIDKLQTLVPEEVV